MSHGPTPIEYFDARAVHYDSRYETLDSDGHSLRSRMAAVVRLVGVGPGEALDVGMGAGRLCARLDAAGWTVSGIDGSQEMVDAARIRLPQACSRLLCAEVASLPFPDATFDVVTATGVLEYTDVARVMSELARVTRPGGRAVVSYPNPHALYGIWKTRAWYPAVRAIKRFFARPSPGMPRGGCELSPSMFRDVLRRAGWEPATTVYTSYLVLPTPSEHLLPRTAARLGGVFERTDRAGHRLATQMVYEARRGSAEVA